MRYRSTFRKGLLLCLLFSMALHAWAEAGPARANTVALPKPRLTGKLSVEQALAQRRSVRKYGARALTMQEVSQLLWAAQGITASWGGRTAPSAGALYPLELYLAAGNVKGLARGLYHYAPAESALRLVRGGDARQALFKACLRQGCVRDAPVVLIIACVESRTARKYGGRATRYVDIEVGAVCQSVHLQCESLGLGTVAVGAFHDRAVSRVMGEKPAPRLLMPIGPRR